MSCINCNKTSKFYYVLYGTGITNHQNLQAAVCENKMLVWQHEDFQTGEKLLNLLSLLQSIWIIISLIYLKPVERFLGISLRRHWLHSSAAKQYNVWWNALFQSRYDYLLCETVTLWRRACLHLFPLLFPLLQKIAIHFFPFIFFNAMSKESSCYY